MDSNQEPLTQGSSTHREKLEEIRRLLAHARGLPADQDATADAELAQADLMLAAVQGSLSTYERVVVLHGPWLFPLLRSVIVILLFILTIATPAAGLWWYFGGKFDQDVATIVSRNAKGAPPVAVEPAPEDPAKEVQERAEKKLQTKKGGQ